jgi:hypothetical protein
VVSDNGLRPMIPDDHRRAMVANDRLLPMIPDDDRRAMVANDRLRSMIPDDHRRAMIANDWLLPMVAVTSRRPLRCGSNGDAGRERNGNSSQRGDDRFHRGLLFTARGAYDVLHAGSVREVTKGGFRPTMAAARMSALR